MPSESDFQPSRSSTQSAGSKETHHASFQSGRHPRISRAAIVLLIVGAALGLLPMYIPDSFGVPNLIESLISLVAVFFLAGSALVVIRQLGNIPKAATSMVMIAACLAIVSQTLTVFEQIDSLDGTPLLGKEGFLHELIENTSYPLAVILLLAGFFFAALEAQTARHHLEKQRTRLSKELAERRRAEKKLEKSETEFRDLVENITDVIYEADSDGLVTYVGPAIELLVGYSPSELLGRPFSEFIYGEDLLRAREHFQEVLAGDIGPGEYRLVTRSGEICWVQTSSRPILEGDKSVGLRGVLSDVTERKQAQEELEESEEKYRHLFEQLNDAAMVADTETGIILDANEQAELLLGRTRDEIIGMHQSQLHPPDRSEYYREMFAAHVARGHAAEFDGEVVRKDGSVVPIMISAATLTLGGKRLIVGLLRDITERKRAERMLQESQRRALALLNAPSDRVALIDRNGVFLALNEQMAESLGGTVEELLGVCSWDLIPSDLAASRKERVEEVFRSGEPLHVEDERAGIMYDNSLYPVLDAEGKVATVAVYARDITDLKRVEGVLRKSRDELEKQVEKRTAELMRTNEELLAEIAERKHAEEALRDSEEKYRFLIDNAAYPITVVGIDGDILLMNAVGASNLGGTPGDFIGKSVYDLFPSNMANVLIERHREIVQSGMGGVFEDKFEMTSGEQWFLSNIQPVRDSGGETYTIQIISQDITESKRAEKALRQSEERYRSVLQDQTELICRWLPGGKLTFVNDAYCRYFEKKHEELIGHSFVPLILDEDREMVAEKISLLGRDNPIETHEQRVVAPDGEVRWQQWTNRAILDDQGRPIEFQSVGRDITERKRAEEQIRAALEEKELLLKEIQHRVKNNLQVVSSLFDLQSRYTDDDQVLDMLKESRNRVKSIALIHEKLYQAQDLARIDFAEYARTLAVHLFRSYGIGSDVVKLKTRFDDFTLAVDAAIPCALIVNELVSNCLKHAFPAGRRGEIRIELRADDGQCTMIVGDDGVGFPESFDLEDPPSLGLRLVRTLTDQLKGTMDLDRDGGTTFRIGFRVSQ